MMAAYCSAEHGNEVHIYEKNDRLGKKIYITGKGRCNLTNAGDVEDFMENIPGNPYFLYSALYALDSQKTRELFEQWGLKTKVERGNRVFPVSDKAADVVNTFEKRLKKAKVKVHLNSAVTSVIADHNTIKGIMLATGEAIPGDAVLIATGGLSYPGTGSTGDGYHIAEKAGHHITKRYPSLVPFIAEESFCEELMGLSLKNVAIALKNTDGKILYKDFGELLFTHFGVSGPVILSASRHILDVQNKALRLVIDLKPALEEKQLDNRLLRDFEKYANKDFRNALEDLLPQKLIPVIVRLSGIDGNKKVHDITKEERKRLLQQFKSFTLTITGTRGYKEAVVTSGGISVDEINPSTMESKLVKGLYFAGELIDVDAYTGGYNLQIAFSTGYLAGENMCAERG